MKRELMNIIIDGIDEIWDDEIKLKRRGRESSKNGYYNRKKRKEAVRKKSNLRNRKINRRIE